MVMEARDVLDVLAVLEEAGIDRLWIDGGWGVEALLGAQHRDHDDLDLVVPTETVDDVTATLAEVGFEIDVDARPTRVSLKDRTGRVVDLHPIQFDPEGPALQIGAGPNGDDAEYPTDSLGAHGWVGGERVHCISPDLQVAHHSGYEPTDRDREDMARIQERFAVALPDAYR